MFISLIVVFARIHSDSIDLQDVIKEHADDATEIKLEFGEYISRDLHLKDRNLAFIGNVSTVTLELHDFEESAFNLENSSLSLVSIRIRPSQLVVFAKAKESTLNLTECEFDFQEMKYPILEGSKSQLLVKTMTIADKKFSSSLIQGAPGDNEAALSLIVQHCSFTRLSLLSQNPLLAGADVQNVSVLNTSFITIRCENEDPLPKEAIEGTPDRELSIQKSKISNVDGALSGALVFGMQASKLNLINVAIEDSANAIRHSNNVAFAPKSVVFIRLCTTKFTNATEVWPNGGFLYLPHNQSSLTIHHTEAEHSTAGSGSGGWIYVNGHTTLDFQLVSSKSASAGKCGGFVFAGGVVEKLHFSQVEVNDSRANENGGALFVSNADEINIAYGKFTRSGAINNGGAVFVDKADNTRVTFSEDTFTDNEASKGEGPDVLFSYENSTKYRVQKSDFVKCTSTVLGYGVWILPFNVGTEWTNSRSPMAKQIIIISVVCGCVGLALCILIPCLCCCCGCCVACGCGRKRKHAEYQHIEAQPRQTFATAPQQSYAVPPNQADPSQPLLQGQNAPQTQINYQQFPQQYVYTQPVDQPTQASQYPGMPAEQVGVDQSINKI
ncbi:hypothetical protein BLNAU_12144 [Blattamonas nauphoetae]|uniref:Uncharacterized protein n=1 Tax=Blattamonas nauphoetae TaxID=2049346 RepID=A0ABQ9XNP7_9EUKA|nr:hypothetical protein BLNAU_12144 [Blattamonas nauphoetae]